MMNTSTLFKLVMVAIFSIASIQTADAAGLSATPSSTSFSTTIGTPVTKRIIVKGTDLLQLGAVSSFNVSLTGPDQNQFTISHSLNLLTLVTALLGGGYPIDVTYNPSSVGSHQAGLQIDGTFLLLVLPLSTSADFTASATAVPVVTPLEVVSIDPANYEEDVPVNKVIRITFNQPIQLLNVGDIILNGVPVAPSWVTIDGNDLVITSAGLLKSFTYLVDIKPTAVSGLSNNTLAEEYTSVFYTEKDHPIIISDYDTLYFDAEVGFSELQVATFIGEQFAPAAITGVTITISGTDAALFEVEQPTLQETRQLILTGKPVDVTYTPTAEGEHEGLMTVTVTIAGQPAPLVVEVYLKGKSRVVTGIEEGGYEKIVVKEELYTLSGVKVVQPVKGIYIKKSFYDDGSSSSEKVIVKE